ncbi:RNase H-like domain found in reverse transcriptase [Popillia japonica]|uniref:RNase H-like domain found in reverse transcriptase n=1 Tax=Popillia japonica TaxID=7064 RepID=A0AAW1KNG5_POPJA
MPKKWEADITKRLVLLYELQLVLYKRKYLLKKINNLRSQFLEVTKKKKVIPPSGSGAEDCVKPNWWLYDSLSFLLPYTKKDKGESNLNVLPSQILLPNTQETTVEICDLETISTDEDQYENVSEVIIQTDSVSPVSFIADSESSHTKPFHSNSDNNCKSTPKTKKRKKNDSSQSGVVEAAFVKALNELDDIKVTAPDDETHLERLRSVLHKLSEHNIKVNLQKCQFMKTEIQYCGYRIDKSGIHKSKEKIEAIQKVPIPKNKTEVKAFVGLVNYYDRIPSVWIKNCNGAFEQIKKQIQSPTMLAHYDPQLLVLATDANPYAVGAVFSHIYPDGTERPIQFAYGTERPIQFACGAFEQIKKQIQSPTMLAHYDPQLLVLATDANPYAVGAVFSHIYPDTGVSNRCEPVCSRSNDGRTWKRHSEQIRKIGEYTPQIQIPLHKDHSIMEDLDDKISLPTEVHTEGDRIPWKTWMIKYHYQRRIFFDGGDELVAYTDSDFGGDVNTGQSTSGVLILRGGPLVWYALKQRLVATSTAESVYRAAVSSIDEICWIPRLGSELGMLDIGKPTTLYLDHRKTNNIVLR